MTGVLLLEQLQERDIRLSANGDRLVVDAPRGLLTAQLRETLLDRKAELLAILADRDDSARQAAALLSRVDDPDVRADLRELFEHRAAVCEFDGGLSRTDAERIALSELYAAIRKADESP
ncbi:MAG: hypothetical protein IH989_00190 [Planctomycetes bacterium]|nr:hypothetical protein [Planctomycetota bacterium]